MCKNIFDTKNHKHRTEIFENLKKSWEKFWKKFEKILREIWKNLKKSWEFFEKKKKQTNKQQHILSPV